MTMHVHSTTKDVIDGRRIYVLTEFTGTGKQRSRVFTLVAGEELREITKAVSEVLQLPLREYDNRFWLLTHIGYTAAQYLAEELAAKRGLNSIPYNLL